MGCRLGKNKKIDPGQVLDRVISQVSIINLIVESNILLIKIIKLCTRKYFCIQANNDDDCLLYKLANYKKGGELIEAYNIGGAIEVEKLIREQFGILMYKEGKGQNVTRTEYLRWKFRNTKHVFLFPCF